MALNIPVNAFCTTTTVVATDLDELNHVNNVVYLRWVQDAAAAHWYSLTTPEQRQRWPWVVRRHEIDYLRPCKLGDTLLLHTWVLPPEGMVFPRMVAITHSVSGKLAAIARTHWQLIDPISQRGIVLPPAVLQLFMLGGV